MPGQVRIGGIEGTRVDVSTGEQLDSGPVVSPRTPAPCSSGRRAVLRSIFTTSRGTSSCRHRRVSCSWTGEVSQGSMRGSSGIARHVNRLLDAAMETGSVDVEETLVFA